MRWINTLLVVGIVAQAHTKITSSFCDPEQVHIAFGEKVNDIVVVWSTLNATGESIVMYGETKPEEQAEGSEKIFVEEGSLHLEQWIHNTVLKDLKYDTKYVYKVGSKLGWSKQFSFKTPKKGQDWVLKALLFGDFGITGQFYNTVKDLEKEIASDSYDFVIHNGDIAYDMHYDDGRKGDKFMRGIESVAANIPYMVSPGNHEFGYNYSQYQRRFAMPSNNLYNSMFYSWNIGRVHFICVNTEAYYDNTDYPGNDNKAPKESILALYNWLEADLKEANKPENREKRPWIILYGHRPMYCSNSYGSDRCDQTSYSYPHRAGNQVLNVSGLEHFLKDYGVDLSVWAHEHTYERMWPLYNKIVYNQTDAHADPYVNPRAPVHVTTGNLGGPEGTDNFRDPPFNFSAFRNRDYGFARLYVHNNTHLQIVQVANRDADTLFGSNYPPRLVDSFWLVRDKHTPYDI